MRAGRKSAVRKYFLIFTAIETSDNNAATVTNSHSAISADIRCHSHQDTGRSVEQKGRIGSCVGMVCRGVVIVSSVPYIGSIR